MFRILVAEDDDNARFLMCEVLRRAGYEPCPARDGVEALEVMEHYQCDLAVVDITMPRMDGITFTQTLREGELRSAGADGDGPRDPGGQAPGVPGGDG